MKYLFTPAALQFDFYSEGQEIPEDSIVVVAEERARILEAINQRGETVEKSGDSFVFIPRAIELQKQSLLDDLNKAADKFVYDILLVEYPDFEVQTFEVQKQEALLWEADPNALTPNVDILAAARGINREVLLQKILDKVTQFTAVAMQVAGQRQKFEDQIKGASTQEELDAITFNFTIPEEN